MYAVTFKESARRELYALPAKTIVRITTVIDRLAANPRPRGVLKLKGTGETLWRIRVGDYRIVYAIEDSVLVVNVRRIGDRKDVYE